MKHATLFGRPNVGKSTLFNRLVGGRRAIVHARPGSTRDGRRETVEWRGRSFLLEDTGGATTDDALHPFAREVRDLAVRTAAASDAVLFLVDGRTGRTPADEHLADLLRRSPRCPPVLLVVNKAESDPEGVAAAEFHPFGFGDPLPISAEHGLGVAELIDALDRILAPAGAPPARSAPDETPPAPPARIAIVGRANAGKSTLLNRLVGRERSLVSDVPGTTRDPVDEELMAEGRRVVLVDTAGIRRRPRRRGPTAGYEEADALAVLLAGKAIRRADVSLLMADAVGGLTTRDAAIARMIEDAGCGVVVLLNRWDLVTSRAERWAELRLAAKETLRHIAHAPVMRVSALTGQGVSAVWKAVFRVHDERARRIPTADVNRFLAEAATRFAPRSRRGREVKILYGTQASTSPPRFRVFLSCRKADLLPTYPRYLLGAIRRRYGFRGVPLRLSVEGRRPRASRRPGSRPRKTAAPAIQSEPGREDPEQALLPHRRGERDHRGPAVHPAALGDGVPDAQPAEERRRPAPLPPR